MNLSRLPICLTLCLLVGGASVGCNGTGQKTLTGNEIQADEHALEPLSLPAAETADLQGHKLQVVATTSIIGDVVAQVGGEAIALTTLMGPGQDPHSYEPSARALTAVADAHVIFVNGWDLEEALVDDLAHIAGGDVPLVPVSARIEPLMYGANHEHEGERGHAIPDPHTWLDPRNVVQWAANIEEMLSRLDPNHSDEYRANAAAYQSKLEGLIAYLDDQAATISEDGRKIVTNHGAFGYFANRYRLEVIGTVMPAFSALAEPSAGDLASLVEIMAAAEVCAIFAETTANDQLAQAAAAELGRCETVQVISLYTGAIGPTGSGADSYIGMMRANMDAIVTGLQ